MPIYSTCVQIADGKAVSIDRYVVRWAYCTAYFQCVHIADGKTVIVIDPVKEVVAKYSRPA